jgi:5-(carboxyamino)imidazole ribonucleotide synthase
MSRTQYPPFVPPARLGVMGGGQLGRMFAHAAQALGYQVAVLDPAADSPAGQAADQMIVAGYTDRAALGELAAQCVAVTTEFENVPADSLEFLARQAFVAPSAACVSIAQDRIAEKRFFVDCFPHSQVMPAPHKVIASDADIDAIGDELLPGILKTVRMGYDGKGQVRVKSRAEVRAAFAAMNGVTCLLEKMLPLAYEVSWTVASVLPSILAAIVLPRMSRVSVCHRPRPSAATVPLASVVTVAVVSRLAMDHAPVSLTRSS